MIIVCFFYVFRLIPIHKNRVVLANVWGFGDNTKYIAEELAVQKSVNIVFITNHPESADAPREITMVKTNSVRAIYYLSTAKVWVECNRKESYIRKRKGQYYIQTWHGGLPLKKIEGDCEGFLGSDYIKRAKWDSAMTDLYVSNGEFCTKMFRRAFWYSGEVLECGTPRNDILIDSKDTRIQKMREILSIPQGFKIAVYAPTYRESGYTIAYMKKDMLTGMSLFYQTLCKTFHSKFVIIIRLHPLVAAVNTDIYNYSFPIIDGSRCRDMYELMEAAEVLITDYSNTMFEFGMIKKPVFLLGKDNKEYKGERGFYFELEELPFTVAETEEELIYQMKYYSEENYIRQVENFFHKINIKETGMASKQVAERIIKVIGE